MIQKNNSHIHTQPANLKNKLLVSRKTKPSSIWSQLHWIVFSSISRIFLYSVFLRRACTPQLLLFCVTFAIDTSNYQDMSDNYVGASAQNVQRQNTCQNILMKDFLIDDFQNWRKLMFFTQNFMFHPIWMMFWCFGMILMFKQFILLFFSPVNREVRFLVLFDSFASSSLYQIRFDIFLMNLSSFFTWFDFGFFFKYEICSLWNVSWIDSLMLRWILLDPL